MYLGMRESMVSGATLRERLETLRRWGYEGVELMGGLSETPDDIKRALRESGIRPCIIGAGAGRDLWALDRAQRAKAWQGVREQLRLAAAIGASGLLLAAYQAPTWPDLSPLTTGPQLQRQFLVRQLQEVCPLAEQLGVAIALEPLNRYETTVFRTLADGVSICREVGSPAMKIMADFFHMNIEEADIAASLTEAADYVIHVHLADSNRLQPGRGHTDFRAGLAALKRVEYEGPLSLECGVQGPKDEALPEAARYIREIWAAA